MPPWQKRPPTKQSNCVWSCICSVEPSQTALVIIKSQPVPLQCGDVPDTMGTSMACCSRARKVLNRVDATRSADERLQLPEQLSDVYESETSFVFGNLLCAGGKSAQYCLPRVCTRSYAPVDYRAAAVQLTDSRNSVLRSTAARSVAIRLSEPVSLAIFAIVGKS